jgi:guanylate kinase
MKRMKKGILFVVSAPSGCGKGAIIEPFLKSGRVLYSVSATTRKPRDNETDGLDYRFINREEFEALVRGGSMLEYAEYCGHLYGTPLKPVTDMLAQGRHVILEIEVRGAMTVKEKRPDAALVFIVPPSAGELKRRLLKRGTETEESLAKRLAVAETEMTYADRYDYLVMNDELENAIEDFGAIIRAEELRVRKEGE